MLHNLFHYQFILRPASSSASLVSPPQPQPQCNDCFSSPLSNPRVVYMTKCQAHYAPLLGFFKATGDEVIREVYLHSFPFNNLISDEVAGSVSAPVKLMERVFTATGEHSRSHSHSVLQPRAALITWNSTCPIHIFVLILIIHWTVCVLWIFSTFYFWPAPPGNGEEAASVGD